MKYLIWLVDVMPEKRKQLQVCIYFQDVHKACPNYVFQPPHMELLIKATLDIEALSFTDRCSGYNQTKIHLEEEEIIMSNDNHL